MTPRTKRQHITDDHGHYGSTQVVREPKPARTKLKKFVEPDRCWSHGVVDRKGKLIGLAGRDYTGHPQVQIILASDWLRTLRHIRRLEKMVGVK